ncbi:MAG: hypothetical protein ABIJ57_14755 [Pseudomonadota bacterium]
MIRPRVTEILARHTDFSRVDPEVLQIASERGTAAHEACLAYAVGLWSPVTDDIAGYLQSFTRWLDLYVIKVLAVEKELIHPAWNYVGHCDLVARVTGFIPGCPALAVIDLKTPVTASMTWRGQIAAYVEAEQFEHKEKVYGGALQIRRDGSLPKMTWVDDQAHAFNAFCGALSAYNYFEGGKE